MPTYDYICQGCKHAFEQFQSITARPLRKCPECGKSRLKRLIGTGAGVIFKGSGFYETDYRSDSYKKAAKADKESSGKSADTSKGDEGSDSSSTTPGGDSSAKSKPKLAPDKSKSKTQ